MAPAGLSEHPSRGASLVPLPLPREADHEDAEGRLSDVDEWGRSESTRALLRRIYQPLYRRWFRVEWEGLEKIPRAGGALLIANHAGAIPTDAPIIMHGIEEELGRPVYGLADVLFRSVPVIGTAWARAGGVAAHPDNAYRLLRDQRQLVLVFPEGTKGTGKLFTERYRLRRFGRGGFVEIAMRAGAPVVPITVIGSEEAMPTLAKSNRLSRLLGVPYVPITANMLLLGPLGLLGYFPAKIRIRVLDPVYFDVEPDQDRYPKSRIFEEAEAIRRNMQSNIYDMLRHRRSVWYG
jgi:1-acyl-sn-glycerol-3-phosphate acyltransferase